MKKINTNALKKSLKKDTNVSVLALMLIAVTLKLGLVLVDRFFSDNNFSSIASQIPEFGFLAIAMCLAMLTGGIDLSIVANANLSGIIAAMIMSGKLFSIESMNPILVITIGIVTAIVVSTLCGCLNGFFIAKLSVPPILATLGTMIFFSGVGMALSNGESVGILVEGFSNIGMAEVFGIPVIFIMLIIALILISFILSKTEFGKKIYLLGENSTALKFSGTDTEKTTIKTYAMIGAFVGISSIIMISRVNSARVGFGSTYQLQAILVSVLAGFDPDGGKGKITGVVLGMTLLQFLQSAFTILNFTPYSKNLIWGAMLILVMIISYFINKEKTVKVTKKLVGAKE